MIPSHLHAPIAHKIHRRDSRRGVLFSPHPHTHAILAAQSLTHLTPTKAKSRMSAIPPSSTPIVRCAILFLDIRGSTVIATGSGISSYDFATFVSNLLDELSSIRSATPAREPDYIKSTGDGFMLVWELPVRDSWSTLNAILQFALAANSELPHFIAQTAHPTLFVGMGLAHGELYRIEKPPLRDYYGSPANLASKLQDAARPSGLVVQGTYFPSRTEAAIYRDKLTECSFGEWAPLYDYQQRSCYITHEVTLAYNWTCLAWPGLAITDSSSDPCAPSRPIPKGLNTKGITVVTHEGIFGKLDTLKMWPRHHSRDNGDPFRIIIDDFDALSTRYRQGDLDLMPPNNLQLKPAVDQLCTELFASLSAYAKPPNGKDSFVFVPIRCGINALAIHAEAEVDPAQIRTYTDIGRLIDDGTLSPDNIAIYDNMGASLPILLLLAGARIGAAYADSRTVYNLDTGAIDLLVKNLISITNGKGRHLRRYTQIRDLALAFQSGIVRIVLGGGAWLGAPTIVDDVDFVYHIPPESGGFLWVEGAAMTRCDEHEANSVLRFLSQTVLSSSYQEGLVNSNPYGSCPVTKGAIEITSRGTPPGPPCQQRVDQDTGKIYRDGKHLTGQVAPRRCPDEYDAWTEAWLQVRTLCTTTA